MYEFFAGKGNLSRCARASGLRTASFDLLYDAKKKKDHMYKSNSMDINSASGFAFSGRIVCQRTFVVGNPLGGFMNIGLMVYMGTLWNPKPVWSLELGIPSIYKGKSKVSK